jgi:hypothetical protein
MASPRRGPNAHHRCVRKQRDNAVSAAAEN